MPLKTSTSSFRSRIFLFYLGPLLPVLLLLAAAVEFLLVPYVKSQTLNELTNSTRTLTNSIEASASVAIRNHLKAIAEKNRDIARHHFDLVEQGVLKREEAIRRLREILLSQRVGSSGYLYCINSEGVAVVHPNPDVVGTTNTQYDFIKEQIKSKNGYLEYIWRNPGEEQPRQKALYMVYFEPLDWIISASSYRSEFDELLNPEDFRHAVLSLQFGQSGYAYIFNREGEALVHPILQGYNIFTHPEVPSEFVNIMLQNPSGSLEYEWGNPDDPSQRRKLAVFQSIPEYGWIIVSSAYLDEIMRPVQIARWIAYSAVILLLMAAAIIAYILSGRLTRPIEKIIRHLDRNASENTRHLLKIDFNGEFGRLAREFNNYMATIDKQNEKLKQERQRYLSLFEASPDAVILLEGQTIIDCNPATLSLFRGGKISLTGKTLMDLSAPIQSNGEDSKKMADKLLHRGNTSSIRSFEWIHQTVDGHCFEAEVRIKPFGEKNGNALNVAFIRDITERNLAEKEIRKERDFSNALIDSSPAYILIINREGEIVLMNPSFCRALGCCAEEVNNLHCIKTGIPVAERPCTVKTRELFKFALNQKNPEKTSATLEIISRKGKEHLVQWSVTWLPEHIGEGENLLLAVGMDVTEEQALQEQLHHSQKLDALGRLAGGVAHDFNNMLSAISGSAQLLEMSPPEDPENRTYVNLISDSVERAAKLTGRLLAFSRKGKSVSKPFNLSEVVKDALRIFKTGLDPKIEVQYDLSAESSTIVGDPSQLQNVFLNLFINARDAMPEGGILRTASRNIALDEKYCDESSFDMEAGQFVEILVADSGTGIEAHILKKIFEPFFTTKQEGKGTGLGLASAYGVVKEHKGEIQVESKAGVGATFTLRLPCVEVEENEILEKAEIIPGEGVILLVDDDEALRITGKTMLERIGYKVILASDGLEALDRIKSRQNTIDLVLLDMVMPRLNGQETFLAIREEISSARIILTSGFTDIQVVQDLEEKGLAGFIRKPYRLEELSRIISQALNGKKVKSRMETENF